MDWNMLSEILIAAIVQGVPLLYGATGEILSEKSGNLNLGIPGIMYVGGISGVIGAFFYERSTTEPNVFLSIAIPFFAALIGAGLMSLIYCFLTVTLRANQNVTGLALTTFGVGIGNFFGSSIMKMFGLTGSIDLTQTSRYFKTSIPFGDEPNFFEKTFLSFGFMTYLSIVIAICASLYLSKTRSGLNLRAVGESPATADAAGINVTRYKYLSTTIGGMIAGLGGLYFVIDYVGGGWTNEGFGDRGWLAVAIVIFALWRPRSAILSSFLFGGLLIISTKVSGLTSAQSELIKMLPYLVTIVVLVVTSLRKKREYQPPASLGLSYFREDR